MAILDTSITGSFNEDRDENIFIGLDLPIRKSDDVDGYFASTATTMEAVKNNIRNILLTTKGERFLQPEIGLNLRRFIFEQYSEDAENSIKVEIVDTFEMWLPFVEIKEIKINMDETDSIGKNELNVFILFNIKNSPNIIDSVAVDITGE